MTDDQARTRSQRSGELEARPADGSLRLRDAVWSMKSSDDLGYVLIVLKQTLQKLGLPFQDCGVNLVASQADSPVVSINSLGREGEWERNSEKAWGQELIFQFWKGGRPVYRRDLEAEDVYGEREGYVRFFGHPVRSVVDVPFADGTLAVNSERPNAFCEADIAELEQLALVLEEAFHRRRDFQRLEERNQQLEAEIARRRQAEREQRESEQKYHALFNQTVAGIYLHDLAGRLLDVNPTACLQTGYSRDELLQLTVFDLHSSRTDSPNLSREELLRQWQQWQPEHRYTMQAEYRRKDGTGFPVELSSNLVRLADRPMILAMVADITERRRQETLQATRERLRDAFWQMQLLADIPDAFGALYRELKSLFPQMRNCSLQVWQEDDGWTIYAITATEVVDVSIEQRHAKEHGKAVQTCWQEQRPVYRPDVTREDPYDEADYFFRTAPEVRSVLDVPFTQGTLAVNSHQPQAYRPEEIAELAELAQLLSGGLSRIAELRSAARYRTLVESPADLVVMHLSLDSRYVYISPQLKALTGYAPETFYADPGMGRQLVHPDDLDATRKAFRRVAAGGPQERNEIRIRRRDGEYLWILYTLSPIRDAAGQPEGVQVLFQDISERRQAEAEKEHLQQQLLQAQKMESVGRLAGGVAHDFNNMLGVILGHTEIALADLDPDQPLYTHLQEIRTAAQRSADITRQLLGFARKQTMAPRQLDLNETVEGMLKMLRRLVGEAVELTWLPGKRLAPIEMDPSQLDQILANLCVNARDAIDEVGRITLQTGTALFDQAGCDATHAGVVPGEYVWLAVLDDGCGMDQETLAHIFEPFFTTKEVGKGTGLGLSTIYGIVQQNHGFIDIDSAPGQGTSFRIYLPGQTRKAAGEGRKAAAAEPPAARGTETILLVEDEPTILKMIAIMLERQGYTVLPAGSPEEALQQAGTHAGRLDLLISDVVMPGMNGRKLAENLLTMQPTLKRLFMSGYPAESILPHDLLNAGVHFIQKPFSTKELTVKIREVLNHRGQHA